MFSRRSREFIDDFHGLLEKKYFNINFFSSNYIEGVESGSFVSAINNRTGKKCDYSRHASTSLYEQTNLYNSYKK